MQALIQPNQYQWTSMSLEDQLKEAIMAFICSRAEHGDDDSPRQPYVAYQLDPYTRLMLPVMIKQYQAESTLQSDTHEDSRVSKKPVMKRKVLKRMPDREVQVSGESITSEPECNSPSDPVYEDLSQGMYLLNTQEEEEEFEKKNQPHSFPDSKVVYSWGTMDESQKQRSWRDSQSHSTLSFEQDLIPAA